MPTGNPDQSNQLPICVRDTPTFRDLISLLIKERFFFAVRPGMTREYLDLHVDRHLGFGLICEFIRSFSENNPVLAEIHLDDQSMSAEFNAAWFLLNAGDNEIIKLARCGWRGDYPVYPVDHVAEVMADFLPDVAEVLAASDAEERGFEVSVSPEQAARFLRDERATLFHRVAGAMVCQVCAAVIPGATVPATKLLSRVVSGCASWFPTCDVHSEVWYSSANPVPASLPWFDINDGKIVGEDLISAERVTEETSSPDALQPTKA